MVVALVAWGLNMGVTSTLARTIVQESAPSEFRARVMSVYSLGLLGSAPIGAVVLGLIMLVIPGIIIACRLALVPYLVMDRGLDAIKAVETSWRMTKGYTWKIFWMGFLIVPILLAGLITFGIGVIVSWMWINAAFAALYMAFNQMDKAHQAASIKLDEAEA